MKKATRTKAVKRKTATKKSVKKRARKRTAKKGASQKRTVRKKGAALRSAAAVAARKIIQAIAKNRKPPIDFAKRKVERSAEEVFFKYENELLELVKNRDNPITGVSVGPRVSRRRVSERNEMAIQFHVRTDSDKSSVEADPATFGIKSAYEGVASEIVITDLRTAAITVPDGTRVHGALDGSVATTVFTGGDLMPFWLTAATMLSQTGPGQPGADQPGQWTQRIRRPR